MPRDETPEQREERKARERAAKEKETPEEREARKAREKAKESSETPEQREERKARERAAREKETPEEREARKAREKAKETPEEREARKAREKAKENETPEQREERHRREREERRAQRDSTPPTEAGARTSSSSDPAKSSSNKERVHRPLPQAVGASSGRPPVPPPPPEPVVEGRSSKAAPAQPAPSTASKPTTKQDDEDDDGYADDFEDGFAVEQLIEAQKAVAAENAALKKAMAAAAQPQSSSASGSAAAGGGTAVASQPQIVGQSRFGVDDLQRQQYRAQYEKDLARATALRRLVDLDAVSAVICDISPLSEYEIYIRNFGSAGRQQTGCQAPALEDKIDVEVQAERVPSKSKGLQCPDDLGLFPEGFQQQQAAASGNAQEKSSDNNNPSASSPNKKNTQPTVDAALLSSFLSRVFPVVRTLLDEGSNTDSAASRKPSKLPLSSTYLSLSLIEATTRPVLSISYSPLMPQYVMVVHGPRDKGSKPTAADSFMGMIVVWNLNDPTMPDRVLVSDAPLTAARFSPSRSYIIYGATVNGAVCVWDGRESDTHHTLRISLPNGCALRTPSYISNWQVDNHNGPVVAMHVSGYNTMLGTNAADDSEQLVTLDPAGNAFFWILNDSQQGAHEGGTSSGGPHHHHYGSGGGSPSKSKAKGLLLDHADHGLTFTSSARLLRSMVVPCGSSDSAASSSSGGGGNSGGAPMSQLLDCFDFDFNPADASRFVAAINGSLRQVSRFRSIVAPLHYAPHSSFAGASDGAPPTSVRFSTIDSRILTAGYSDGSVRLYLRDEAAPQLTVPCSLFPIRSVRCSPTIKLMTFALDEAGEFFILDHGIEERDVPVLKVAVGALSGSSTCTAFDVPSEVKGGEGGGDIVFGFADGTVQLHAMTTQWMTPAAKRTDKWM